MACTSGQENEIEVIKGFLTTLFNENIPPSTIIDDHMIYSKNSNSYSALISHINEIRNGSNLERGWLMPNHKIKNLSNYNIFRYTQFIELDKLKLKLSESEMKRTYVLLNDESDEILQYFLLEEGKIKSFTLFGKGKEYWFFGYE